MITVLQLVTHTNSSENELSLRNWHMQTHPTAKDPTTQKDADRIKVTQMKKENPDTGFIQRTEDAAKKNEAQGKM